MSVKWPPPAPAVPGAADPEPLQQRAAGQTAVGAAAPTVTGDPHGQFGHKDPPGKKGAWTPPPQPRRRPPSPAPDPPAGQQVGMPNFPGALQPVTTDVNGVSLRDYCENGRATGEASTLIRMLVSRPEIGKRFKKANVGVIIVPASQRMTDIPELTSLRGTRTFDGRPWDDVRGLGGMYINNQLLVAIPEENLANMEGNAFGPYSVSMHELAHVVLRAGMSSGEQKDVSKAFKARTEAGGPWTEAYGSSNEEEYFAQASTAWFGRNQNMGNNGASWVRTNDPRLAEILEKVYGPGVG